MLREGWVALCSAAAASVLVAAARRKAASPPYGELASVYANIRKQADERALGWPHAEAMLSKCTLDAAGRPHPPAFTDGHGPIGAYAMLRSRENLELLRWCREAFDAFVSDLRQCLPPNTHQEFDRMLWVNAEWSYHSCVTVFHEHPSLLSEVERAKWQPVDATLAARLACELREATSGLASPALELDSLSVTADGAFIVGFTDDRANSFQALRVAAAACGQATIGGQLTSRPKALIHVTLGRVLGAPAGLTPADRASVARVVRHHNGVVLPTRVERAPCRTLQVSTLSLARDAVWWMTEHELIDTWDLRPSL